MNGRRSTSGARSGRRPPCQAVASAHAGFDAMPHRPSGAGGPTAALGRPIDDLGLDRPDRPRAARVGGGERGHRERASGDRSGRAGRCASAARRLGDDDPGTGGEELTAAADARAGSRRAPSSRTSPASVADGDEARLTAELDEAYRLRGLAYGALQLGRDALQASGGVARRDLTLAPSTGRLRATRRLTRAHATMRSVWLRNTIRGAVGLALAVFVGHASSDLQNGFWVVLGTLSVLRSTALTTGAAVSALAGTARRDRRRRSGRGRDRRPAGDALDAAAVRRAARPRTRRGRSPSPPARPASRWSSSILFNLIDPAGWEVGLARVEDVAIGGAVSLATASSSGRAGFPTQHTNLATGAYAKSHQTSRWRMSGPFRCVAAPRTSKRCSN